MTATVDAVATEDARRPEATATPVPRRARTLGLLEIVAAYALLAGIAVLTSAPGEYVLDNRFDWFWAPERVLSRTWSLWDAARGLGGVNTEFSPGLSALLVLLREVGVGPAATERVLHALLLVLAGTGAVAVMRVFAERVTWLHAVVGVVAMFNPFTATFLVPSALFAHYSLAPWMLVCVLRGVRDGPRWTWAARFALVVFAAGFTNVPGLVWAALPVAVAGVVLACSGERRALRTTLGWFLRAGALTAAVSVAGLARSHFGSARLVENLSSSESVASVAVASSWSESWRGLGYWLVYWTDGRGAIKPNLEPYLAQPALVLATFVLPVLAVRALFATTWRPRVMFGAMMLAGLVAMVGPYPIEAPSPLGSLLVSGYEASPTLFGLRNSYKAGPALALAVAVLSGVVLVEVVNRASRRRRRVVVALFAVVVAAASFPFWTGRLYPPSDRMRDVPDYYDDAFAFLDRAGGSTRVLTLPGTAGTTYRWGSPGDDMLDALMPRPHVERALLPVSSPPAATLISALDEVIQERRYTPGTLAPIARRIGVEWVMIRNDLDWRKMQRARPADLEPLRNDPDLRLVATFGAAGENTWEPGDDPATDLERALPPIEIYRIGGVDGTVRTVRSGPSLLVSGDGAAWPALAADGTLDRAGPVRFTGELDARQLRDELRGGAGLVVTDTNRRTPVFIGTYGERSTYTHGAVPEDVRGVREVFGEPGARSLATWPDARAITVVGDPGVMQNADRPSSAFDHDLQTAWLAGAGFENIDARIRIEFERPQRLDTVLLVAARPFGFGRRASGAELRFSDGSNEVVDLRRTATRFRFAARTVSWVEIGVSDTVGDGLRPVGYSEILFPDLDLREFVRTPSDVFRRARGDQALRDAVAAAPVRYSFERLRTGLGEDEDEEPMLRREFETVGDRTFEVRGRLRVTRTTPDAVIDALAGGSVGAVGSERYAGELTTTGRQAVDDDLDTAWRVEADAPASLTTRFGTRFLTQVAVVTDASVAASGIDEVTVVAGDQERTVPVLTPECDDDDAACAGIAVASFDLALTDRVVVRVGKIDARRGPLGPLPIAIREVLVDGESPSGTARSEAEPASVCTPGLLVDGEPVAVRVVGDTAPLLEGDAVSFEACAPVRLPAGDHRVDVAGRVAIDALVLESAPVAGAPGAPPDRNAGAGTTTAWEDHGRGRISAPVEAAPGDVILSGQAFDEGWRATLDGIDLGAPRSFDTLNAWVVPEGFDGTGVVRMVYGPQRPYEWTLVLSALAAAGCVVLARPRWRRRDTTSPSRPIRPPGRFTTVAVRASGLAVAFLVAGATGLVLGGAVLYALVAFGARGARATGVVALVLLAGAAVATLFGPLELTALYADERPLAGGLARAAAVCCIVYVADRLVVDRREVACAS